MESAGNQGNLSQERETSISGLVEGLRTKQINLGTCQELQVD
jgi:hypothetical protein